MAKKKGGNGVASSSRVTRSATRFDILDGMEEDFPALTGKRKGNMHPVTPGAGAVEQVDAVNAPTGVSSDAELPAGIDLPSLEAVTGALICQTCLNPKAAKDAGPKPATVKLTGNANTPAQDGGVTAEAVKLQLSAKVGAGASQIPGQTIMQQSVQGKGQHTAIVQKPWTSLFKDNRAPSNGLKLRYVPSKGKSLDFSDRILPTMVEMWGFCLVGFITGKFPGLKAIYDLKNAWGVSCLVKSHAKRWIIFKFQNDEDRTKVLNGGPYTIFGMQLMLKSLSEDFSFDDDEFLKVPIWVKFPNLHMKLWNEEAMSEVASMVGVPLATDKVTQDRSNHLFARVLIEVDVSQPPPLSFPIRLPSRKVVIQSVVYETFPNFCIHCKVYGHHPFICKKLATKERDMIEAEKGEIIGIEGIERVPKDKVKENAKVGIIEEEEGVEESAPPGADVAADMTATPVTSPEMEVVEAVPKTTPVDTEDEESDTDGPLMSDDEELLLEEYWAKIKELRRLKKEKKEKITADDPTCLG